VIENVMLYIILYCLKYKMLIQLFLFNSYLNNRVYVSLANGDICIYYPDTSKYNNKSIFECQR